MKLELICEDVKLGGSEKELLEDYLLRIRRQLPIEFNSSVLKLEKISSSDFVIVLDETGQKFSSTGFAKKFEQVMSSGGYKRVIFVVGGAYGVDKEVKERADLTWSFSDQVFPHRLFCIMLAEQIYRTLEIIKGSPYHHE